ncbi:MAG: EthD family reductase [Candidatus Dormibacteria bacterium]
MVKLVALYKKPENTREFDERYAEHMDLVAKQPFVLRAETARVTGSPFGDTEYYWIAEMYFEDHEAMAASLASDEARAAGKQLNTFARGLYTLFFADVSA